MLCEICKQNNATTHIKTSVNGKVTEMHLCDSCAAKHGIESAFSFESPLSSMLTSIFGDTAALTSQKSAKRCKCCNTSFDDIVNSGKLGCSECYETFFDELLPYLKRVHGSVKHIGKALSADASSELPEKNTAETKESLKAKLKEFIETENFEEAAAVRDRIKALEEGEN